MKYKYYLLFFVYWILLGYFLDGIFHFFSTYRLINVVENFCFTFLLILIVSTIDENPLKRKLINGLIVLITIMVWFETIMYYQFKIMFGPSSFYVVINTNPDELLEFIKEFVDIQTFIITLLFFIPLLKLKSIVNSVIDFSLKYRFKSYRWLKVFGITVICLIGFKYSKLINHNLPYLISRSVVKNYYNSQWIDNFNTEFEDEFHVVVNRNPADNNTFIVVIGESTTPNHMQLYNYYRPTTPLLQRQMEDLFIYNDVISSHVSTMESLSRALTLGNYEEPKKRLALPIISLFKKAGFKTFWISSHSPAFNPNSVLTRITTQADSRFYNSKQLVSNNLKHDGDLLPIIDDAINDSAPNKIIFVHLIGAHFSYKNRYPKEFDFFNDEPKTIFNGENSLEIINHYDNAIRYTDYITYQILSKLKEKHVNSFLMFFSDHGEEVFQSENFYGHFEDKPSANMFKIPFFLWCNSGYNYPEDYVYEPNREYMTDDLWHSIAHLSHLESQFIEPKRSIFSSNFQSRRRIILNNKDYNTFFNEDN